MITNKINIRKLRIPIDRNLVLKCFKQESYRKSIQFKDDKKYKVDSMFQKIIDRGQPVLFINTEEMNCGYVSNCDDVAYRNCMCLSEKIFDEELLEENGYRYYNLSPYFFMVFRK
jgi:hypothetical protein